MSLFSKKRNYADGAIVLHVEGMHCSHCIERVSNALSAVKGVKKASAYLPEGTAEVIEEAAGAVDKEALVAAVNALGFKATL